MLELEQLAKMGLSGWPLVAAIGIVCCSIIAFWNGRWPWTGIVTINKYYGKRRHNDEEDED